MREPTVDIQMMHLNGNVLTAIFIEVTGDNPLVNDIIEICAWPVDNFLRPSKLVYPFYHQIQPFRDEAIDYETASMTKEKIAHCKIHGLEPSLVADRLEEWVKSMNLPRNKKLVPLCYDWPTMRAYLTTWLGFHNFRALFSTEYRDIMATAIHTNDHRNLRAKPAKYPRVNESTYLANQHAIHFRMADDVMVKCLKIAETYHSMMRTHSDVFEYPPTVQIPHNDCSGVQSSESNQT